VASNISGDADPGSASPTGGGEPEFSADSRTTDQPRSPGSFSDRLRNIADGLGALRLNSNALGAIGAGVIAPLNESAQNSVEHTLRAAGAFDKVESQLNTPPESNAQSYANGDDASDTSTSSKV
jgi:hypothetical protein